jgi:signal peptidase I
MEDPHLRKLHPALAFAASLFGFAMGYVYVGRLRLAVATIGTFYGALILLAWTRLIVYSAAVGWLISVTGLFVLLLWLIHPVILAVKERTVPANRYNRWWFYVIWTIGFGVPGYFLAIGRANVFGYEPFRIPSTSMSPTVEKGDFILADTWRYRSHPAVVGEIVIVERPENPGVKYIKRVVAVAGDAIEFREGHLYRNGEEVVEPYLHAPMSYGGAPKNMPSSTLGPGLIFLLGDYRDNSMDSRQWGPFSVSSLRGRAQYIWLSLEDKKVRWGRIGTSLVPPP